MRTLAAFVVTLLVLLGGGVAADALLTDRAETAVGELLADELDADADVRFGPWPVSLWLLGGSVPEADVVLREVAAGEVRLRRVSVELREVTVDAGAALARSDARRVALRAAHGRFDAEMDEDAVARLTGATVRVRDGQATVDVPGGEVSAVAGVEDGAVVLRPVGDVPDEVEPLRFEPPPLPGDARLTRVELREAVVRLSGEARGLGG